MIIKNFPFAGMDIKTINVHLVNKNGTKDILSLNNIDNELKTIELRASTFRRLRDQLEALTNGIFTNAPAGEPVFAYNNGRMENSSNEQPYQGATGSQTAQKGSTGVLQTLMSIRDTIIEMGSDFNEIEMKEFFASDRSFYVGIGLSSVKIGILPKDKDALLRVVPNAVWDAQQPEVLRILIECSDELFERYKSA